MYKDKTSLIKCFWSFCSKLKTCDNTKLAVQVTEFNCIQHCMCCSSILIPGNKMCARICSIDQKFKEIVNQLLQLHVKGYMYKSCT